MIKICSVIRPILNVTSNGLRAVSNKASYWKNGEVLDIYLFSDARHKEKEIGDVAEEWLCNTSLKFNFVGEKKKSDIRIDYQHGKGSWSYIGVDALHISKNNPTMVIGWEGKDVIYHEFGHALAMLHEHQSPELGIKWNKPVVTRELAAPPNRWKPRTIQVNVFESANPAYVNYTSFDPESVMLYFFPDHWTLDGKGTKANSVPSLTDLEHVSRLYPKQKQEVDGVDLVDVIMDFPDMNKLNREQLIYLAYRLGKKNFTDMSKKDILGFIDSFK